ncbi:hypothetical protein SISSUDRAFT_1064308 [Sistotremastrum suecicum HHB10207 ss-3]|uniref:Uncharacterized protein n=1 Tax=Sistotremastrum suecicum HHB10207 ss-3 TaxID=1314776 RepID=A0A166ATV1_9AGAM|nr:hypothetical protein SISSUDRAFT_1064308 [Sistotremastrum suecicum HHB10207 ss-3]
MPNFRFCNPQRIFRSRGLSPPEAIFALGVVAATHFKEQLADDLILEHYYRSARDSHITIEGERLSSLQAAARYVTQELHGPREGESQFIDVIVKQAGGSEVGNAIFGDMETALRFHKRDYEADIFRHGTCIKLLRQRVELGFEDDTTDSLRVSLTFFAKDGVKTWPQNCYFYYASLCSQTGIDYLDSAKKGIQCSDCTPFLRKRILYEVALNMFSLGITHLSLDDQEREWWRQGARYLRDTAGAVEEALQHYSPDSAETKIMAIFFRKN